MPVHFITSPFSGGGGPTYRSLVVATVPNLVAYWPMDNQGGELTDQVGSNNVTVGASSGSSNAAAGVEGGSRLYAAGGNDIASLAVPAAVTIGCLFRRTTGNDNDGLHGRWNANDGVALIINTDQIAGAYGANTLSGATTIDSSSWYFAMFSSGTTHGRRLWLNTASDASSGTVTGHGTTGSSNWEFGAYSNSNAGTRYTGHLAHCWVANAEVDLTAGNAIAAALTP